ncbi:hypothetical protein SMACR_09149 [Sordaria macrospora]|uniref:WGS project CABT00000000 data, contig 2.43 n=2 Tax=Sordaria macrospora TaxID=5147 RepID=F7W8A3_SORMK|nr:uncharacterized protein SMAC_09149 [Sordaria macrospora k-hell]KAA8631809.1 hypothetical protein SMACR_09149 [Sordaria macrospora]KAH7632446.1 hypothetical protein B0T09DRAFT_317929 [Sordaria sp. MPI-SDFR-AT-0083]WPJ61061.1 hypothetical protein SMAC4_09149 [Sordaria macrospora]CCC13748.1 unnamed protein product [Sordaria macrospora k-hell]
MADTDDLSQEELLCFKPAHEIYDTYCQAGRDYDLVVAVTKVIIVMLLLVVIGIFLWVNAKGWDLPQKRRGNDVEGQAYSDRDANTEAKKGHGNGKDIRSKTDTVDGFVETIHKLAVEGKIPWEAYEVVKRVREEQARGATKEANGGGFKEILTITAEIARREVKDKDNKA